MLSNQLWSVGCLLKKVKGASILVLAAHLLTFTRNIDRSWDDTLPEVFSVGWDAFLLYGLLINRSLVSAVASSHHSTGSCVVHVWIMERFK
ncbi:hypothetical protein EV363DRAFT_63050 [Boletus edulis]|nr:hypothetical protein EV363DRAFT_63050 [Boletus edulis]